MKRTFFVFVVLFGGTTIAAAQDCAQTVMKNLYAELEAIDVDGERRLAQAIEALSSQESWSNDQRQNSTLSIAENPEVDAAEKERTEILANLFGIVQRGVYDCEQIYQLRDNALNLEKDQWESAISQVNQKLVR
jgi:hypothetical protein